MFTDRFAAAYFDHLISAWGIRTVVETGTYRGASTIQFARRVEHVVTIEVNAEYFEHVQPALAEFPNVVSLQGNSAEELSKLSGLAERVCFFLDAHWPAYWPLLDELRAIRDLVKGKRLLKAPVVLIHDFKVPGHPEIGYDHYAGQDLDWEYVRDAVFSICPEYRCTTNEQVEGNSRGILRCEPPL
jgi:predicted O-methyltransferase YrrM